MWNQNNFWSRNYGTKEISILEKNWGSKKFWKKIGVKKILKKELKAKIDFGSEKIFGKKLWVQKNFDPKKKF